MLSSFPRCEHAIADQAFLRVLADHNENFAYRSRYLGTLGTFEGAVARFLARKLRGISKELTATNQKVGSSNLSGRTILPWRYQVVSNPDA